MEGQGPGPKAGWEKSKAATHSWPGLTLRFQCAPTSPGETSHRLSEQRVKSLGSGCLSPTTYRVARQDAELCLRLPSWATFSTTSRQHHGALIYRPPGNWPGAIYGCEVMITEALFSPINVEKLTMKEDFV